MAYTLNIICEEKPMDIGGQSVVVGEHGALVSAYILCLATCNLWTLGLFCSLFC